MTVYERWPSSGRWPLQKREITASRAFASVAYFVFTQKADRKNEISAARCVVKTLKMDMVQFCQPVFQISSSPRHIICVGPDTHAHFHMFSLESRFQRWWKNNPCSAPLSEGFEQGHEHLLSTDFGVSEVGQVGDGSKILNLPIKRCTCLVKIITINELWRAKNTSLALWIELLKHGVTMGWIWVNNATLELVNLWNNWITLLYVYLFIL